MESSGLARTGANMAASSSTDLSSPRGRRHGVGLRRALLLTASASAPAPVPPLPSGCQPRLDAFCSSVALNGASCINPQRLQFGHDMRPYYARFDRSSANNRGKAWRCYSHEALSSDLRRWDPHAKTPSAFCSEGSAIVHVIGECSAPAPPPAPVPPCGAVGDRCWTGGGVTPANYSTCCSGLDCSGPPHDANSRCLGPTPAACQASQRHQPAATGFRGDRLLPPLTQIYVVSTPFTPGMIGGADGTARRPFGSLTYARDAVRLLQPLAHGVQVNIGCGVHSPLLLTAVDSGTAAAPIVYRGGIDGDGSPCALVTAGLHVPASAFSPWNAAGRPGILRANLTALGMNDFGAIAGGDLQDCQNNKAELFYDKRPMALARWPNNPPNASNGQTWARTLNGTGEGKYKP